MIHGVLLINKIAGGTSHDTVSEVRRILGQKEVGHAGALDPLAKGLLLILLGYGTKLSNYLLNGDKQYRFTLRLGVTTDTLDKTGVIVEKKEVQLSEEQIKQSLEQNQGLLSLPVPLVSAVKVKGKKLYEYKRANQAITVPVRDMLFYDLEIKNIQQETAEVLLSCSKGSYIRSWVSFMGEKLGTGACLESLTRLKSNPFNVQQAITLDSLEAKIKSTLTGITAEKRSHKALGEPVKATLQPQEEGITAEERSHKAPGEPVKTTLQPLKEGITAEQLHKALEGAFIPFSQALPHIRAFKAGARDDKQLRQGRIPINLKERLMEEQKTVNKSRKKLIIRVMSHNNAKMLALLELKPFISPKFLRVFPPDLF